MDKEVRHPHTYAMTTANPGEPQHTEASPSTRPLGRIPADTFSNRLLLARKLAGLSQREAAAAAGVNYGSWSNWENGMRPLDLLDVAQRIASALDVDFNWLLLGGSLAGPRGVPTNRVARDTHDYPALTERTTSINPFGRPHLGVPAAPRRAARVGLPVAA